MISNTNLLDIFIEEIGISVTSFGGDIICSISLRILLTLVDAFISLKIVTVIILI